MTEWAKTQYADGNLTIPKLYEFWDKYKDISYNKVFIENVIVSAVNVDIRNGGIEGLLKCSSVVVPLQDKAPVRFIVMNFEIGHRSYEMEAVFCNEKMLMVGENSGVWTRLEWINEFNIPKFNIETALHPYWRPE